MDLIKRKQGLIKRLEEEVKKLEIELNEIPTFTEEVNLGNFFKQDIIHNEIKLIKSKIKVQKKKLEKLLKESK